LRRSTGENQERQTTAELAGRGVTDHPEWYRYVKRNAPKKVTGYAEESGSNYTRLTGTGQQKPDGITRPLLSGGAIAPPEPRNAVLRGTFNFQQVLKTRSEG
jgi:hypothetical protein